MCTLYNIKIRIKSEYRIGWHFFGHATMWEWKHCGKIASKCSTKIWTQKSECESEHKVKINMVEEWVIKFSLCFASFCVTTDSISLHFEALSVLLTFFLHPCCIIRSIEQTMESSIHPTWGVHVRWNGGCKRVWRWRESFYRWFSKPDHKSMINFA